MIVCKGTFDSFRPQKSAECAAIMFCLGAIGPSGQGARAGEPASIGSSRCHPCIRNEGHSRNKSSSVSIHAFVCVHKHAARAAFCDGALVVACLLVPSGYIVDRDDAGTWPYPRGPNSSM